MEENMINQDELNSIAYFNKKRKLQAELLSLPSPKHACWGQSLECEFSSDSTVDPKKVVSSIFVGGESLSNPEYLCNSYTFHGNADSSMSSHASLESSSSYRDGTSSRINRKLTEASSSKSVSSSVYEELDSPYHDYADNYEDHLQEFGGHADVSFSEYQNDCENKELEDLLYSSGLETSNYVLSSGRWSVNQDSQEKTKKLTIDKEFEQYFSMLML